MKKINVDWGDIFYSEDMYRETGIISPDDAMLNEEFVLDSFFGIKAVNDSKCKEYADLYGKLKGLEKYAVLSAHGGSNEKWTYYDNNKEHLVQDWINSVDGKYSTLLIPVCNPKNHTPKSKKSLLFIPDRSVGTSDFEKSGACFSLIAPRIGEINSYMIDYELNKLKETENGIFKRK